jgi:two-component system, NtrC family, sensor histidine kinase GlrK
VLCVLPPKIADVYYPRSLTNVILACFVLSAVPLVVALAELALGLDALAKRSQLSVREAEAASTASRELRDIAGKMERAVRQSVVLEDATLLDNYRRLDAQLEQTLVRAQALALTEEERKAVKEIERPRAQLKTALRNGVPPAEERPKLVDSAADLSDATAQAATLLTRVTEREVVELRTMASRTRENWPWFLGVAAVTALLLAVGFSVLIARPLRNIDRSIRKLGRGEFADPIAIKGPRDLRSLGERLDWLRRRLLELETHQSRFLRHVSHELKTPLTAVREGSELLNDRIVGEMSKQQTDVVRIIRDNTVSLQRLIEDLLSYQQHRSAAPLKIATIEVKPIVDRVVREHRLEMLSRAIAVETQFAPTDGANTLDADQEQLRVVLDNLVSNAIKYTPRGGKVRIATARDGEMLQIDVEDEGPGIAAEEQERIFDSFYRGEASANGKIKGTGLGLAIVREYVLAHRGSVYVVDPGKPGGKFRVRLPVTQPLEMREMRTLTQLGETFVS